MQRFIFIYRQFIGYVTSLNYLFAYFIIPPKSMLYAAIRYLSFYLRNNFCKVSLRLTYTDLRSAIINT